VCSISRGRLAGSSGARATETGLTAAGSDGLQAPTEQAASNRSSGAVRAVGNHGRCLINQRAAGSTPQSPELRLLTQARAHAGQFPAGAWQRRDQPWWLINAFFQPDPGDTPEGALKEQDRSALRTDPEPWRRRLATQGLPSSSAGCGWGNAD